MDDGVESGVDSMEFPPALPSSEPRPKPAGGRDDRLAARLRENLRKRKEQARRREKGEG